MIGILDETGKGLTADIANMLRDDHVSITTDGWTSCANEHLPAITVAFITAGSELVTLPLNYTKSEGSTKGKDLAEAIEGMVTHHDPTGRVVTCTIDCEPTMVKTGRILRERIFCTHIGCCNYPLESATAKKTVTLARAMVNQYTKSSQAVDRLA